MSDNKRYGSVAKGVWRIKDIFVNVYLIAVGNQGDWVLLDTGLRTARKKIFRSAARLFPSRPVPIAIVMTHAHFDHAGSLKALLRSWTVPVYAHSMEVPYLSGVSSYPPPDPTVGGGLMSLLSFVYPSKPINIGNALQNLPNEGVIPCLPDWRYIHTPGHAPGHISLYRPGDRLLLSGDAFVTTKQESLWSVIWQTRIVSGPPKYFTYDWNAARHSVRILAALNPSIVAAGHGRPMKGTKLNRQLVDLADRFNYLAIPRHGRYVHDPAIANENGVVSLPPA